MPPLIWAVFIYSLFLGLESKSLLCQCPQTQFYVCLTVLIICTCVTVQHSTLSVWLQVLENKKRTVSIWTSNRTYSCCYMNFQERLTWIRGFQRSIGHLETIRTLPLPTYPFHSTNLGTLSFSTASKEHIPPPQTLSYHPSFGLVIAGGTQELLTGNFASCDMTWVCQARITVELTLPNH